jgi:hypothetical protein
VRLTFALATLLIAIGAYSIGAEEQLATFWQTSAVELFDFLYFVTGVKQVAQAGKLMPPQKTEAVYRTNTQESKKAPQWGFFDKLPLQL